MSYIQSHQSLADHPKTAGAAELLGIDVPTLIGHLHLLWWWALDYAPDGDLSGFSKQQLCNAMRCKIDANRVISALVTCNPRKGGKGFLERKGRGYVIHDWRDFAGKFLERKEKDAARKREERANRPKDRPADAPMDSPQTVQRTSIRREEREERHIPPIVPPNGEDFTKFWNLYPRKQAKARAEKAWAKWAKAKVSPSVILDTLKAQLPELKKREREYIPLPATWLNGEPWRDEPEKSAEKQGDPCYGVPEIVVSPEFWREDW